MGTWGASLYEDDTASDMKNAVTRVAKVPADGDQLLACLLEMYGPRDPADEDGILFWLVVAFVLKFLLVGFAILGLLWCWFLWRSAKGWLVLLDDRPIG